MACSPSDENSADVILGMSSLLVIIKLQRTNLLSSEVLSLKNDVSDIAVYSLLFDLFTHCYSMCNAETIYTNSIKILFPSKVVQLSSFDLFLISP